MITKRTLGRAWLVLSILCVSSCGGDDGGSGGAPTGGGGTGGAAGAGGVDDPFAIDECAEGTHTCAANADCIDTSAFYECACHPGYEGDGRTCTDIDECASLLDDCDPLATCTNEPGSFSCSCPSGTTGDGRTCEPLYLTVAAGQYHACAIRQDGTMWCWGHNTSGQVGTGTADPFFVKPMAVGGARDWTRVVAGGSFTCALNEAHRILCWGTNGSGQLGDGTATNRNAPTLLTGGIDDWVTLESGSAHTCAIRESGALYCWGYNIRGQIGDGTTTNRNQPVQVGTDHWLDVSAGNEFTCGVRDDHTLWCWGLNTSRQLGDNTSAGTRPTPTREATLATDWAQVSTGGGYACGVKLDGSRWCWGTNALAQAGNGAQLPVTLTLPQRVDEDTTWARIDAGEHAACALRADRSLWCWGEGSLGQTAQPGAEGPLPTPAQVGADTDWLTVASGLRFACGVQEGGRLSCWGSASRGATGLGFSSDRTTPTPAGSATDWTTIAVQLDNGCGLRGAGNLYCWGRNAYGHLGDATTVTRVEPTPIGAGKVWKRIALGRTHTCGIADESGLDQPLCWGWDNNGEQGNGAALGAQTSPAPVVLPVPIDVPWVEIATGYNHACAVRQDGTLWCWGRNASGQLGDGTLTGRQQPVRALPAAATDWTSVVAHGDTTCGLRASGALHCWGGNGSGQLGLGHTTSPVHTPTLVDGGPWAAVDISANHTCGVDTNGSLWCWGRNANSEAGIGNAVNPLTQPTRVGQDSDWARPFLGQGLFTCALKTNGDLYCWGAGSYGQLGLGSLTSFNTPQRVPSLAPWDTAAIGNEHTCGVSSEGRLFCWGSSTWAQLGGGQPFNATPMRVVAPGG
ncbi:EGF domain-containing protein [Chondromyces crocatus]|uniref:EGF-like domain-containing protein n=1 Tax=Chondromyces crocatus TaxID=52 RepID=A0A0K1E9S2_CHOCO|nr:EGF domain-containing protein [Chondromyces crocatus]AKT37437.1 uncharacterized protein CMC5_015780 [Chondromyces crocatus]